MANLRKGHVNNFDQRPTNKNVQELQWITINDKFYMKTLFYLLMWKLKKLNSFRGLLILKADIENVLSLIYFFLF